MHYFRWISIAFIAVTLLIAACFWLYLNMAAQLTTQPSDIDITLPKNLSTTMQIDQEIKTHSKGRLNTDIKIDRTLYPLLQGKYPAQLAFKTMVPIKVRIKYDTFILIDDHLSIQSNTDLVYEKKYLPKFPIKLDIPLKLKVPFTLDQEFDLMVGIDFNDQVIFDFDELIEVPVKHRFRPVLDIDDDITLKSVSAISAELLNQREHTRAKLKARVDIPFKNITAQPNPVLSSH